MPALNQNIIIHDLDRFQVRFSVTDAEASLNDDAAAVWWGVATEPSGSSSTVKIQKSSGSFTLSSAGGAVTVQNYGGITLSTTTVDVEIPLNSGSSGYQSGSIFISLDGGTDDVVYYHECVYAPQGVADDSVVIATGTLTVKPSLFTHSGYRA